MLVKLVMLDSVLDMVLRLDILKCQISKKYRYAFLLFSTFREKLTQT